MESIHALTYTARMLARHTSLTVMIALIAGSAGSLLTALLLQPSDADRIAEFYRTEVAVHVSPHGLRKQIYEGKNSATLVDLRSAQEYEREHIVGAVNIPAYSDPDHSAYDDVERIVGQFRALPQDKPIIVYCYSMPCMTGRKIGAMLADHGILVQHLGIGWNEWRHFWTLWNHEHEWSDTSVTDYVTTGKEPGTYSGPPAPITPCTEGTFGC